MLHVREVPNIWANTGKYIVDNMTFKYKTAGQMNNMTLAVNHNKTQDVLYINTTSPFLGRKHQCEIFVKKKENDSAKYMSHLKHMQS